MRQNVGGIRQDICIKPNSGLTLIELIVSVLVSSVVILSAVLFISFALNRYRDTAEETDLMMESQIAVNAMREVLMEACVTPAYGIYSSNGMQCPYLEVVTSRGTEERYYHLFVLDKKGKRLLYYGEDSGESGSAVSIIQTMIPADGNVTGTVLKQYFMADHVSALSLEKVNRQLFELTLEFENNGGVYQAKETVLVRNTLPEDANP